MIMEERPSIKVKHAYYTRCTAPYSMTGYEGFGWRYADPQIPQEVLESVTPFLPCKQIGENKYFKRKLYLRICGYFVLIGSTCLSTSSRGGNFFAHVMVFLDDSFGALDAACALTDEIAWVAKDELRREWRYKQIPDLPSYHRSKGKEYKSIHNFAAGKRSGFSDKSGTFLNSTLAVYEFLLKTECLQTLILSATDQNTLSKAIQLISFSLPDKYLPNITYISPINGLRITGNAPPPLIIGWIITEDSQSEIEYVLEKYQLPQEVLFNYSEKVHTPSFHGYTKRLRSIWSYSEDIYELEYFVKWIEFYFGNTNINPMQLDIEEVVAASFILGFDRNGELHTYSEYGDRYLDFKQHQGIQEPAFLLILKMVKFFSAEKLATAFVFSAFYADFFHVYLNSESQFRTNIFQKISSWFGGKKDRHFISIPKQNEPPKIREWLEDKQNIRVIKGKIEDYLS